MILSKRKRKFLNNNQIELETIAPFILQRYLKNNQSDNIEKKYWDRIKYYFSIEKNIREKYLTNLPELLLGEKSFLQRRPYRAIELLLNIITPDDLPFDNFKQNFKKLIEIEEVAFYVWKFISDQEKVNNNEYLRRCLEDSKISDLIVRSQDHNEMEILSLSQILAVKDYIQNNCSQNSVKSLIPLCFNNNQEISQIVLKLIAENIKDIEVYLKLIESGLPRLEETAKNYFLSLEPTDDEYYSTILILCDSPFDDVQVFGLDLIKKNISYLPRSSLLKSLAETKNKIIQEYVAHELKNMLLNKKDYLLFELDVLKTRNEKRKLKELVKNRIERAIEENISNNLDKKYIETLVSLTLGLVEQDKSWAIRNLTSLKINNYEIKDLELKTPIKK